MNQDLIDRVIQFRDDRDWKQFHNLKDLSVALSIEAGELLELFLWKQSDDVDNDKLKEELADIFLYGILLAYESGFDIEEIVAEKLMINESKYPIELAKGNATKYNMRDDKSNTSANRE